MKLIILSIILVLTIGYIVTDYFSHPDIDNIQKRWMLCGMDMQVMEIKSGENINNDLFYTMCDALVGDDEYTGGLQTYP